MFRSANKGTIYGLNTTKLLCFSAHGSSDNSNSGSIFKLIPFFHRLDIFKSAISHLYFGAGNKALVKGNNGFRRQLPNKFTLLIDDQDLGVVSHAKAFVPHGLDLDAELAADRFPFGNDGFGTHDKERPVQDIGRRSGDVRLARSRVAGVQGPVMCRKGRDEVADGR